MNNLDASFFARPSEVVAREILGCDLISTVDGKRCVGRIVETEAYHGPDDDASHAAARIGRTPRNEAMFGRPGLAYVYRIYGIHWCLNAVTDALDFPAAVLIRAAEPIAGVEIARARRGDRPDHELMRGPGNLCSALGITGALDMHDLAHPPLVIARGTRIPDDHVRRGPRIGITRAADLPLRFFIDGNPSVSRMAGAGRRARE
jgi:DNA-3-methyladenine glycosylase